jgi:hypothetical protein
MSRDSRPSLIDHSPRRKMFRRRCASPCRNVCRAAEHRRVRCVELGEQGGKLHRFQDVRGGCSRRSRRSQNNRVSLPYRTGDRERPFPRQAWIGHGHVDEPCSAIPEDGRVGLIERTAVAPDVALGKKPMESRNSTGTFRTFPARNGSHRRSPPGACEMRMFLSVESRASIRGLPSIPCTGRGGRR